MSTGGTIVWNLDIDPKGYDSKLSKASRDARNLGRQLDRTKFDGFSANASAAFSKVGNAVSSAASQLIDFGKKASLALGTASIAAGGFAVKSAADFEQTRIGLENMLGSADKARSVLKQVSDFAAQTPFEFPELANSVKQLVAFGFSGEDAIKTMKQLGDVSAAIGTPIGDLSYLMGTLRTQGRAFTIDIRQFAQRGVPIYEYLAKVLKTNEQAITEMIEAGKIGFPEVQKAFEAMTSEGGKFHGAMAKQSKSLSGLFSTLKDNIGQTARELVGITREGDVKTGSLFDNLRKGTAGLIESLPTLIAQMQEIVREIIPRLQQWASNVVDVGRAIAQYLAPKFEALWNTIKESLPTFERLWKEVIVPLGKVLGTVLVFALGLVIDAFNLLMTVMTPVISFLLDNKPIILGLAAAFGILAAAMAFHSVAAAFTTSMASVNLAFARTSALIATPLVMPALVIAAALASIWTVFNAVNAVRGAVEALESKAKSAADEAESSRQVFNRLFELQKTGNIDQRLRAADALRGQGMAGFASGTNFAPGGLALVGERGPELVNLPRGSQVIPNNETESMLSSQKNEYHIGTINIASEVDGEKWLKKLTRNQEVFDTGLVPSRTAL